MRHCVTIYNNVTLAVMRHCDLIYNNATLGLMFTTMWHCTIAPWNTLAYLAQDQNEVLLVQPEMWMYGKEILDLLYNFLLPKLMDFE